MSKKSECLAWLIRRHGIEMTHLSGGSHIGSVLSAADIIAVLYADIMRYKSEDPKWDGRDRFIMSKGHAGAAVYAALAECGFFDTAELKTHYADGSRLSGHVSHHLPTPPSGGVVLCDVSRDFFCNFPIFCFSLRAAFHICNRIKNSAGVNKCTGVKRGHALNGEYE